MRIDPWLLAAVLIFCGVLVALLLATAGGGKQNAVGKRLRALKPSSGAEDAAAPGEEAPREILISLLSKSTQRKVRTALSATGDKLSLEILVLVGVLAGVAVGVLASVVIRLSPPLSGAAATGATIVAPWLLLRTLQVRHSAYFLKLFPDAIDLIVRAVRAGLPVSAALDAAGQETPDPVGIEFRRVLADIRIGLDLDEALTRAARRIRLIDFDFFVASLVLQRKSGGNLAETLAVLSSVLRRREELRSKTKAMTSEARASAVVLAGLPFFVGGAILFINPEYFSILFTDPNGAYVMGGGLLSLTLGMLSMRILIQKALT
jgi:tight adherence protein B